MSIDRLVYLFRKAIDNAKDNKEKNLFFRNFPAGQCGHASDMLAQYLIDNGISKIEYVNGTYYGKDSDDSFDFQSHAWLVVNGLIIDITADQFMNREPPLQNDLPIYIGPINAFYRQFESRFNDRHPHYGINDSWTNSADLRECYKTILSYI